MHPPPPADDPTLIALAVDRVASALLADEQPQVKLDNYVYQGNVVHCDRYIYLPQSMLTQFERLECKTFSGILPEINRVYITIDNRLFLFNYIDGSIYAYQDFNQIVISVALVTPKPDVFIDEIEYLLAVATPSEIVILGVRFDGGSQTGNIELVETSYYTCSDGVHMLKLVCTPYPSSRIFAAGKDGRVYEIDYQPGTRWFSKKCRKLSHMSLIDKVSVLFPVLKLFQTHDPLIDLIVDPRKANLYGLTQASSVCKYELGQDLYDRCQGPYSIDAGRLRRSLGIGSEPDFAIVALSVDHGQYGVDVCAITNHGHRIYLKSNPGDDLVIDSIRICPRYIDAPSTEGIRQQYKPFFSQGQSPSAVKNALYVDGAFVAADMRDPRFDTLIVMTVLPSAGHSAPSSTTTTTTAVPPQPIIVADENVESHVLDCRVHDMKAIPQPLLLQQAPLSATLYRSGSASTPLIGLSSMAIQHAMPPPKFVVLTATRVMFFGLSRPLEQLTQILSTSSSAAAVQAAMGKFGMAESCAMLLTIICSSTAPPASEKRTVPGQSPGPYTVQERRIANANIDDHHHGAVFSQNQVVRQAAIDAFMSFGGEPSLKLKSLDHNVCYSHAHNALYMFASRVIRSIWFRSLVEQDQRELIFRYTPPIIGAILRPLMQLQRFINEYQIPQSRLFQSHDVASGTLELTSIGALEKFLSHTIEILQLVGIIQKTDTLSQITQIMDSGDRFVLESNSFKDLVVTSQGTRCIKGLIRSFLEVEGPGCSSYITSLQSMCPSFIDSTDLFLFNGNQLLAESGNQSFQGKATKLQREAIESFKKASANIDFPLQNVIPKLMDKGLLNDAITLCLWRASSLEKVTSSDSMMAEDDRMYRQTIAVKQKVAYQTACSCLDDALFHPNSAISQQQITAALTVCLQSTCATFLNDYFFPFYVQKCSVTYDVKSEKFQQYLVRHRLFDRLRQYFVALRKFQEGAKFFAQLPFNSEMTGNQITVRDRIRYLEIAVELNRYCSSQDDSLVFELRKAIELGEIQSQLISHLMAEKSDISEHGSANATSIALDNDLALCMSCLLNGEKLYTIGCRYSQFETCLKILCVEDSRQHGDVVAALYANIISSIIKERESLGADWRLAVKETIARLGRQYRLSTFMFPASLICELLEQYNITRSPSASQAAAPFVGPLMLDQVNYPVDQMIAIYSHLVRHWTLSRDGLYASILYILSPSHVDALSSNTLLFQKTVASAIDLCDLCLSLPDNTFADQFRRMRQLFMKKKSLAS